MCPREGSVATRSVNIAGDSDFAEGLAARTYGTLYLRLIRNGAVARVGPLV